MVVLARLIDCVFQNDAAVVIVTTTIWLVVVDAENPLNFGFVVKLEKMFQGRSSVVVVVVAVDW